MVRSNVPWVCNASSKAKASSSILKQFTCCSLLIISSLSGKLITPHQIATALLRSVIIMFNSRERIFILKLTSETLGKNSVKRARAPERSKIKTLPENNPKCFSSKKGVITAITSSELTRLTPSTFISEGSKRDVPKKKKASALKDPNKKTGRISLNNIFLTFEGFFLNFLYLTLTIPGSRNSTIYSVKFYYINKIKIKMRFSPPVIILCSLCERSNFTTWHIH